MWITKFALYHETFVVWRKVSHDKLSIYDIKVQAVLSLGRMWLKAGGCLLLSQLARYRIAMTEESLTSAASASSNLAHAGFL